MADRFNKATFEEWAAHPLTERFRQYLRDHRDLLMEDWASGALMEQKHQAKALLFGQLESLQWADLAEFYDIPVEETED